MRQQVQKMEDTLSEMMMYIHDLHRVKEGMEGKHAEVLQEKDRMLEARVGWLEGQKQKRVCRRTK